MAHFASRDVIIVSGEFVAVNALDLNDPDCKICYCPFNSKDSPAEEPIQLLCGHVFGLDCILRWALENPTCPYCRSDLFKQSHKTHHSTNFGTSAANLHSTAEVAEEVSFEIMYNWEEIWYDSMDFDLIYTPPRSFDVPLMSCQEPFAHIEIAERMDLPSRLLYQPLDWQQMLLDAQNLCACRLSYENRNNMSRAPDHYGRALQLFNGSTAGLSLDYSSDELSSFQTGFVIYSELDINALDVRMDDLTDCHKQWMRQYTSEVEYDPDDDEDLV